MCSLKVSVSSTEATASYTKQAVFWAQYGGTRDHVAAFNGAVAVLKTCWMHDWMVSGEVVIFCCSPQQLAKETSRCGKRTTPLDFRSSQERRASSLLYFSYFSARSFLYSSMMSCWTCAGTSS